jgi:hypothetical protein
MLLDCCVTLNMAFEVTIKSNTTSESSTYDVLALVKNVSDFREFRNFG